MLRRRRSSPRSIPARARTIRVPEANSGRSFPSFAAVNVGSPSAGSRPFVGFRRSGRRQRSMWRDRPWLCAGVFWWRGAELNCRHHDFQSGSEAEEVPYVVLCCPTHLACDTAKMALCRSFARRRGRQVNKTVNKTGGREHLGTLSGAVWGTVGTHVGSPSARAELAGSSCLALGPMPATDEATRAPASPACRRRLSGQVVAGFLVGLLDAAQAVVLAGVGLVPLTQHLLPGHCLASSATSPVIWRPVPTRCRPQGTHSSAHYGRPQISLQMARAADAVPT